MLAAKSLVIVDLQPEFKLSINERIIQATQNLIIEAKQTGTFIFTLEYEGAGKTLTEITSYLSDYSLSKTLTKTDDGGGHEVFNSLIDLSLPKHCVICGVNTYACVLSTLSELTRLKCNVDLAIDACRHKRIVKCDPHFRRIEKKEIRKVSGANYVRSIDKGIFALPESVLQLH